MRMIFSATPTFPSCRFCSAEHSTTSEMTSEIFLSSSTRALLNPLQEPDVFTERTSQRSTTSASTGRGSCTRRGRCTASASVFIPIVFEGVKWSGQEHPPPGGVADLHYLNHTGGTRRSCSFFMRDVEDRRSFSTARSSRGDDEPPPRERTRSKNMYSTWGTKKKNTGSKQHASSCSTSFLFGSSSGTSRASREEDEGLASLSAQKDELTKPSQEGMTTLVPEGTGARAILCPENGKGCAPGCPQRACEKGKYCPMDDRRWRKVEVVFDSVFGMVVFFYL